MGETFRLADVLNEIEKAETTVRKIREIIFVLSMASVLAGCGGDVHSMNGAVNTPVAVGGGAAAAAPAAGGTTSGATVGPTDSAATPTASPAPVAQAPVVMQLTQ